ncbi:MAG: PhzF family phenazine biosynthesis protein [Candidatus Cloacimonetes bacterium]|nr:PhzF family phenazine biosynthesis protein [Candidatus Cloacimonadota bacterium]
MRIPIYQVDAFTDERFRGNPAAVCILQQEYIDTILQNIAAEMNLSETAFLFSIEQKSIQESSVFSLRWFTPKVEVPLCGHATLATAAVLFYDIGIPTNEITFMTKSGKLIAKRDKNGILLNFPVNEPVPIDPPKELIKAIGIIDFRNVVYARKSKVILIHLDNEESVKNLKPNFELMKRVTTKEDIIGVIVTSPGYPPYDFISRFFAPWLGINEDPVTGAAHTVLTPYWSKILGKREMLAYQSSSRGGKLVVQLDSNDRVNLIGNAVIVLKGELYL